MPGVVEKAASAAALAAVLGSGLLPQHASAAATTGRPNIIPVDLVRDRSQGDMLVYSIPIRIGTATYRAWLDTGSLPTLILAGRVPRRDAQATGKTFSVTYGGSRTYAVDAVSGPIKIGASDGTIPFGVVTGVKCVVPGARCPTTGEGPRDAFFIGRYSVIVGARVVVGPYPVTSAFRELGVHSFVLTVPRQGEGSGTLQLDPNANVTSAFVPIANDTSGLNVPAGSARGCLRNKQNGASFCGAVFLDTGRTGIEVFPANSSPQTPAWSIGDAAQLEFTGGDGSELAGVDFSVGADTATKVTFGAPGLYAEPVIYVGQLPYLGLSILTNFDTSTYAVAPRSRARDGVVGHVP